MMPVPIAPGMSIRPVTVGVKPRMFCANSGKMNVPPYSPKPSARKRTTEANRSRFFSTRKFTMGCLLRGDSSQMTRATRATVEMRVRRVIIASWNQSFLFPSSSPYWREPRPEASRKIPGTSILGVAIVNLESLRKAMTMKAETIPMGMLTRKIQGQE